MKATGAIQEYSLLPPSLGEEFEISFPSGFVVTSQACQNFVHHTGKKEELEELYGQINREDPNEVMLKSFKIRKLFAQAELPNELAAEITENYREAGEESNHLIIFPLGGNPLNNVTRVKGLDSLIATLQKLFVDHLTNGIISKYGRSP